MRQSAASYYCSLHPFAVKGVINCHIFRYNAHTMRTIAQIDKCHTAAHTHTHVHYNFLCCTLCVRVTGQNALFSYRVQSISLSLSLALLSSSTHSFTVNNLNRPTFLKHIWLISVISSRRRLSHAHHPARQIATAAAAQGMTKSKQLENAFACYSLTL